MEERSPECAWLRQQIADRLSPKRYIHSLAVAELAEEWAAIYGLDGEQAYIAGLLHDAARDMSNEELLAAAERYHIPVDELEADNPLILHAEVASHLIGEQWGVKDALIQEAVARHTIPELDMSTLAKVIYLADICEPNRHWWPGREVLIELARRDLDAAMAFGLSETMEYLQEKGLTPHPHTMRVLGEYQKMLAERGAAPTPPEA